MEMEKSERSNAHLAKEAFNERKYSKAFPLSIAEMDAGDPDILYNLGFMYYFGRGVKRDRCRGMELVARSAEHGCKYAMNVLLWMRFDRRDLFLRRICGLLAGISASVLFFRVKDSAGTSFFSLLPGVAASFAAGCFTASSLVSILYCGISGRFETMAERAGKFVCSLLGGGLAGFLALFFALIVLSFFTARQGIALGVGTAAALAGALAGFYYGGKIGACVGESAAQSLACREEK